MSLTRRAALASMLALAACERAPPVAPEAEPPFALGGWPRTPVDVFTRFAGVWSPGAGLTTTGPTAQDQSLPTLHESRLTADLILQVFVDGAPEARREAAAALNNAPPDTVAVSAVVADVGVHEVRLVATRMPEAAVMTRLAHAFVAAVSPELNAGQMTDAFQLVARHAVRRERGEMPTPNARIGWEPNPPAGFTVWAVQRGDTRLGEH